jgi:hypothetical protein
MKTPNKKTGFHSISLEIEKEEVRVRWHHVARAAWKSPGIYSVYLLLATLGLAGLGGAIEGICTGSIDFALIRSRGNRDVVLPIVKDGRESVFWAAVLSSAILGAALAGLSVRDMFFTSLADAPSESSGLIARDACAKKIDVNTSASFKKCLS